MRHIKLFEDITDQSEINIDEVIELLIDLEEKEITLKKNSSNYLIIRNINGKLSIVDILDRISDVLTQFDGFEIFSINAIFVEKRKRGWSNRGEYKFLAEYDYHTYEFLKMNYNYTEIAHIRDIKKYTIFSNKEYDELYILFQKKKNRSFMKKIKSFFKK